MKISRTLLSYAGTLGLVSITQAALGQTAPVAAPPPAAAAPAPAAAAAPATATVAPAAAVADPVSPPAALPPPSLGGDVMQPPPAMLPPPPPPVDVAPVPPPSDEKAEPLPKKLAAAKEGWLKFGGLLQGWYSYEYGKELRKDPDMGKYVDNANYFRLRRAYFGFDGSVVPDTVDFKILVDFAKVLKGKSDTIANGDGTSTKLSYYGSDQDSTMLLDFALTYRSAYADVTLGQWKSPIGYEGSGVSSSELAIVERPYSTRYFGDNFDIGVKAEKKFEYVKYSAQVLQGGQSSTVDSNKQKDLALRLEFYPIEGLYVGGAGVFSVGQRKTQSTTREVIEVDAGYDKDGVLVRGEMIWGKKGATDDAERPTSRGMNLTAAYTIAKKFQPAFRVGVLDIDQTIDPAKPLPLESKFGLKTDQVRSYEVTFNYLLSGKNAKLSASYGYYDLDAIEGLSTGDARQQFILQGQVAY